MADARIRRQIALLAARLMYDRQESEYFTAKRKAARQLGVEYRYRPKDLPSNAEIRDRPHALPDRASHGSPCVSRPRPRPPRQATPPAIGRLRRVDPAGRA